MNLAAVSSLPAPFLTIAQGTDPAAPGSSGWQVLLAGLIAGIGFGALIAWSFQRRVRPPSGPTVERLSPLLEHPDCMLWEAEVKTAGDTWEWKMTLQSSGLARRIFEGHPQPWTTRLWSELEIPECSENDRRCWAALRAGKPGYEQRFRIMKHGRALWVHESVAIKVIRPGQYWLVGLLTDISLQQEAELARRSSEEQMNQLMSHANCMLWQANVRRDATGHFSWEFFVPRSELYRRIAGEDPNVVPTMPWGNLLVPEYEEIENRSRDAMNRNLPSYEQVFRVIKGGEVLWMHEQARIVPAGPDQWKLNGVVIDITAQRRAEEAQQASEKRLAQLLARSDCMIWQGRVSRRADGELSWSVYLPPSRLFRRIFNCDPTDPAPLRWGEVGVPEYPAMRRTVRAALASGAGAYEQTFHLAKPDGELWLTEQVTINPAPEPGNWDLVGVITDITARHVAEEARRATEEQLRQLLELADCMVWEATVTREPDDTLSWSLYTPRSLLFRRIFGEECAEIDLNWHKLNLPELGEMRQRALAAVKSGATGYSQEFRVIQPQQVLWLQEVVTIMPLAPGRVRMVGVITDISARRGAEQAVRASEIRYRSLFQHTPVAIVETDFTAVGLWLDELRQSGQTDLAGWLELEPARLAEACALVRVTDCNETALRVLQAKVPPEGRPWGPFFDTPGARRVIRAALLALWAGRNKFEEQMEMSDQTDCVHHMDVRWWIAQSEGGLDLSQSVFVFVDLTELKHAEAALAAEKERLAVTLRAMAEGVITTDVEGRVLFINPAAAELTEWRQETAIGRPLAEVCRFANSRSGQTLTLPLERADVVTDLPPKTSLTGRGGQMHLVEGCCAPIHSAESRVIGAVLVFRDVTEQDRLEEELVRATRLESVGVLAGGIAHDFNNILTAVMGNLTLARLDIAPGSPAGATLEAAEKATLRARDLTQELLTFAKGGEPVRAAIELDAIVREVAAFTLHGSQVKATYDLAEELWPADADKGQISRVVQNLVINAAQAMPQGGQIIIRARNARRADGRSGLPAGDFVELAITDTGEGISPENLARIFEPYFTTKQAGSGLGLAAVYSIIKKHRGHIEVESQPGGGTTFRLWLPALAGAAVARGRTAPKRGRMQGRVLFMDDEKIIRDMATQMMTRFGLEVECASEGAEAVDKYCAARATGRPFDVVVMDLTVPGGMGGLATLARLQEIDPAVRAIVSSGYSSDPVLANYRAHGFRGMVAKPYEFNEFAAVLEGVMAGAASR